MTDDRLRLKLALSVLCGRNKTCAVMRVKDVLNGLGESHTGYVRSLDDFTRAEVAMVLPIIERKAEKRRNDPIYRHRVSYRENSGAWR